MPVFKRPELFLETHLGGRKAWLFLSVRLVTYE